MEIDVVWPSSYIEIRAAGGALPALWQSFLEAKRRVRAKTAGRRLPWPYLVVGAVLVPHLACRPAGSARPGSIAGPVAWIEELHRREVLESPDLFLGNLVFAARGANGATYLSDLEHARVLVIDSTGTLRLLFGRRGGGPGELRSGGTVAMLAGDSLLGVVDGQSSRLKIFSLTADSVVMSLALPWMSLGSVWNVRGDSITAALTASADLMIEGDWRSGRFAVVGTATDRMRTDQYTVLQHGRPEVLRWKDGFLGVFPTEEGVHLLDASGKRTGVVRLPVRARRGLPDGLFDEARTRQFTRGHPKSLEPVGSMLMGLHRLTPGHVVIVFLDVDQREPATPGTPIGALFGNMRFYVTMLSPELDGACVDAEIRLDSDMPPVPFFRGDSMFVIERQLTDEDRVRTSIRAFRIDPSACAMKPTGGTVRGGGR